MALLQNTEKVSVLLDSCYLYVGLLFLPKFICVEPNKPPYFTGFNRDQLYKNIPLVLHQMIGVGRDKSNK